MHRQRHLLELEQHVARRSHAERFRLGLLGVSIVPLGVQPPLLLGLGQQRVRHRQSRAVGGGDNGRTRTLDHLNKRHQPIG
jgi:hypothetical protein